MASSSSPEDMRGIRSGMRGASVPTRDSSPEAFLPPAERWSSSAANGGKLLRVNAVLTHEPQSKLRHTSEGATLMVGVHLEERTAQNPPAWARITARITARIPPDPSVDP